jgi:hypothetical protein
MSSTATLKAFEKGEHCAIRPVLGSDLVELARIMAQAPCRRRPEPLTHERLRKQYEDEKKPGLWSETDKTYVVLDSSGAVVGFIQESYDMFMGMLSITMHVDDLCALRDAVGAEMLILFRRYLDRWRSIQRITCEILELEQDKASWLTAAGFELELAMQRAELYRGRAVTRCAWAWMSEELKAQPAWSEGEPDYSRASRPVKE